MSNINLTVRPAMPSADWTSQNPLIYQFEICFESDTHRTKVNLSPTPTAYNSLAYDGQSTGISLLSSTTVHTNIGTKQALYTVPAGKHCVPVMWAIRNPSTSLAAMADTLTLGFNAGADDVANSAGGVVWAQLDGATKSVSLPTSADLINQQFNAAPVGNAADVLGCVFADTSIDATVVIDVFGYLY